MDKEKLFYEGKAKKLFTTSDSDLIIIEFKDDAAALDGRKKGFSIPIKHWFKSDLYNFSKDILFSKRAIERGLFDNRFVKQILSEHESGKRINHHAIWSLLNLEIWCQTFLD